MNKIMWQKTYSEVFKDVTKEEIWAAWTDVNHWHLWDNEIEWCKIETPLRCGKHFSSQTRRHQGGDHYTC